MCHNRDRAEVELDNQAAAKPARSTAATHVHSHCEIYGLFKFLWPLCQTVLVGLGGNCYIWRFALNSVGCQKLAAHTRIHAAWLKERLPPQGWALLGLTFLCLMMGNTPCVALTADAVGPGARRGGEAKQLITAARCQGYRSQSYLASFPMFQKLICFYAKCVAA